MHAHLQVVPSKVPNLQSLQCGAGCGGTLGGRQPATMHSEPVHLLLLLQLPV